MIEGTRVSETTDMRDDRKYAPSGIAGALGRNVGVVPPAKVVVGATVGMEDTPDAMSESGTAVGFVDASVKVSEFVGVVPSRA